MKRTLLLQIATWLCLLALPTFFTGCKVGDDDPALSFRSRDARLKANWKLRTMESVIELNNQVAGGAATRTHVQSYFDGYDMHVKTFVNGIQVGDSTFGYNYQMMLQEKGKVAYENTVILLLIGTKSVGEDNWYWIDTDQKKARVYLGSALQFPATAGAATLQTNLTLPFTTLLTDFKVEGLKNKELKLSYQKNTNQTTIAGFQQVSISSKFTFDSK